MMTVAAREENKWYLLASECKRLVEIIAWSGDRWCDHGMYKTAMV